MTSIRIRFIVGIRALTTLFFVATTIYGLLSASAFAYHQFIRPGLFPWLVWAARDYRFLLLGVLSLTLLTLVHDVAVRRSRIIALAFVMAAITTVLIVFAFPGFETRGDSSSSLGLAAFALVPLLWIAAVDHFASWPAVFEGRRAAPSSESRIFMTAAGSSLLVWALYATLASLRAGSGVFDRLWLVAVSGSLLAHATAFAAVAWVLVAMISLTRRTAGSGALQYAAALACLAVAVFAVLRESVLPALALRGAAPHLVAALLALTIAGCWSGVALRLAATDPVAASGVELFFRPLTPGSTWLDGVIRLILVALAAHLFIYLAAPIDWGFLLQKTGVLCVWILTWGTMYGLLRSVRGPSRRAVIVISLLLVIGYRAVRVVEARASRGEYVNPRVTELIERYAAYDASFKVLSDAGAVRSETSPAFYGFLSAHANVDPAVAIAPTRIEFGPAPTAGASRRPDIFLFVIDSLRPDYVSAYNPAVTFTPHLGAFAADSLVFRNAFSRYGGTGLSVPAIFSGTMLPHRQYVLPFAPMNALGRLLQDEGYEFAMSFDSIVRQLGVPPPDTVELRAGHGPTSGDFCDTLSSLQETLVSRRTDSPLFVYALPQNVHVAYVASQRRSPVGYPGFHAPTAAQLARLDDCFGRFVRFLKSVDRFDNSLIVVTSDHGDSLGEDGRWGHAYAGFPEIFRIPLIVHLPVDMRSWSSDLSKVSFSTDITPTIYTLLGGRTDARSRLFGEPLVWRGKDASGRRNEAYLLASSYGPVYGLLTSNGRRLYVVDAINARDYAFDLTEGTRRVNLTAADRTLSQQRIAEQLVELSTFFGYSPER